MLTRDPKNCILEVTSFRPDVIEKSQLYPTQDPFPDREPYGRDELLHRRHSSYTASRPIRGSHMELSPTGRSTIPSGERASIMDWISTAGDRFSSSSRGELNHSGESRANGQNSVAIDRIRVGLDVRTTVCLF